MIPPFDRTERLHVADVLKEDWVEDRVRKLGCRITCCAGTYRAITALFLPARERGLFALPVHIRKETENHNREKATHHDVYEYFTKAIGVITHPPRFFFSVRVVTK